MPKHRDHRNRARELDCFDAEPLLEAYVDDELAPAERLALERHVERCETCAGELDLARRIQGGLRQLPPMSCPPAVTRSVLDYAASHPPLLERLRRFWGERRVWQPVFAVLAVVALGVGYWRLAGPPATPTGSPTYSEEEIAQATAELKLALAYLGNIGDKARTELSSELSERVVAPFSRSIAGALFPIPQAADPGKSADGGTSRDVS